MLQTEWALAAKAPLERLRRYTGFSPILAQILFNRGLEEAAAAEAFVNRFELDEDICQLRDVPAAVERINAAIDAGEPIAVYGDFDADGVCSTALMTETLEALGGTVSPYIPERDAEGYGLNSPALERLARAGIGLVVTVDCGIRSVDEVAAAKRAGLDIIITDHHTIGADLPSACAVINPQREDCPGEAHLAGSGVAFMLASALLRHRWKHDRECYPQALRLSDLLDLVALGTVADVMPLNVGLNRRLVHHGLAAINQGRRPGLRALAQAAGLKPGAITARDIAFGLGPRINAAGRLDSAMTAYDLLRASTPETATTLAFALQEMNRRRQVLTHEAQSRIDQQVDEAGAEWLIFAGDEGILPGIVGLVAGRLAEAHYRPAVVLEIGPEESRASCRSIPEFDITRALDECADLLARHGGHALAAGFTVRNSNMEALRQRLTAKARASLIGKTLRRSLHIDCEIDLADITMDLLAELEQLEPTGQGNPPPSFLTRDLKVLTQRRIGQDGKHLKLRLGADGGRTIDAIGFGMGDKWTGRLRRIDAVYQAEVNEWRGRRSLQMRLLDIAPSKSAG